MTAAIQRTGPPIPRALPKTRAPILPEIKQMTAIIREYKKKRDIAQAVSLFAPVLHILL